MLVARRLGVEDVRCLRVARPRFVPPVVLSGLVNGGLSPARILKSIYGIEAEALPRADVIVSAGGDTLAANIAAARILGVPNIFYGSLRRYRAADFALVLTSYVEDARVPHPVMTLKPSPLDARQLARGSLARSLGAQDNGHPVTAALLIGGDAGTVTYSAADWDRLLAFMDDETAAHGTRWVVSNSRRTPGAVSDRLGDLASSPASPIAQWIDVRTTGAGTLAGILRDAHVVVCTADSSSMVSETVWIRRPVVSVAPDQCELPPKEQKYRRYLERQGWVRALRIGDLTPLAFRDALSQISPPARDPADELADILRSRLPKLFARS